MADDKLPGSRPPPTTTRTPASLRPIPPHHYCSHVAVIGSKWHFSQAIVRRQNGVYGEQTPPTCPEWEHNNGRAGRGRERYLFSTALHSRIAPSARLDCLVCKSILRLFTVVGHASCREKKHLSTWVSRRKKQLCCLRYISYLCFLCLTLPL